MNGRRMKSERKLQLSAGINGRRLQMQMQMDTPEAGVPGGT